MKHKPTFWDTLTPHQKLTYAIRHGKEPVRYDGEEVEAARKQEEERELIGCNSTQRQMTRERKEQEAIINRKRFGWRTQKYIQKRAGNIRNHVERLALLRCDRKW